jgi:hypothetical protein
MYNEGSVNRKERKRTGYSRTKPEDAAADGRQLNALSL